MTLRKLLIRERCAICLNSAVDKILLTGRPLLDCFRDCERPETTMNP